MDDASSNSTSTSSPSSSSSSSSVPVGAIVAPSVIVVIVCAALAVCFFTRQARLRKQEAAAKSGRRVTRYLQRPMTVYNDRPSSMFRPWSILSRGVDDGQDDDFEKQILHKNKPQRSMTYGDRLSVLFSNHNAPPPVPKHPRMPAGGSRLNPDWQAPIEMGDGMHTNPSYAMQSVKHSEPRHYF